MDTIIMKQVVIGASKIPRKNRQAARPGKSLQSAVSMRTAPHESTHALTTLPRRVF
jgi:hypothetical protein